MGDPGEGREDQRRKGVYKGGKGSTVWETAWMQQPGEEACSGPSGPSKQERQLARPLLCCSL